MNFQRFMGMLAYYVIGKLMHGTHCVSHVPITIKDIQIAPSFAQGYIPPLLLVSVVESKITTCKIFL